MVEDSELEKIRLRKLRELLQRQSLNDGQERPGGRVKSASVRPVEVTDATFGETVRSHPLVVIDCWAPWCAPCRMIAPIIEGLAQEYAGRILFGKLNVDQNQTVAMRYQVMGIPMLLVFKNGKLVDRIVGAMPRHVLEPRIVRHL